MLTYSHRHTNIHRRKYAHYTCTLTHINSLCFVIHARAREYTHAHTIPLLLNFDFSPVWKLFFLFNLFQCSPSRASPRLFGRDMNVSHVTTRPSTRLPPLSCWCMISPSTPAMYRIMHYRMLICLHRMGSRWRWWRTPSTSTWWRSTTASSRAGPARAAATWPSTSTAFRKTVRLL